MSAFLFLVALCISIIGSICGIGGGVIIKPVLDAMNRWPAHTKPQPPASIRGFSLLIK